jgi:hypothetical protein
MHDARYARCIAVGVGVGEKLQYECKQTPGLLVTLHAGYVGCQLC